MQEVTRVEVSEEAARQRAAFDEVAHLYERNLGHHFGPMAWKVVELVKAREGEKVLDVATGTGFIALALAPIVRPTGFVIGVDISQKMLDAARNTADIRGIDNIEFMRRDAASLARLPTNEFHIVTCGLSLQHFSDLESALREMHRTTAPGGRLVVSVWGEAERNELEKLLFSRLRKLQPQTHSPYALGEDGRLEPLVKEAGFSRVKTERVEGAFRFRSLEAFWDAVSAMGGPKKALDALSATDREALEKEVEADLAARTTEEGFEVANEVLYLIARKS